MPIDAPLGKNAVHALAFRAEEVTARNAHVDEPRPSREAWRDRGPVPWPADIIAPMIKRKDLGVRLFRWRRKEYLPSWGKVSDNQGYLLGLWVDKPPREGEDLGIMLVAARAMSEGPDPLGRINPALGYHVVPNQIGDRKGFFVMFARKDQSAAARTTGIAYFAAPGE